MSGADAYSFGKVLYKYYSIIQLDLQQIRCKFSLSDPHLCRDAGEFTCLNIAIGLHGDGPLQDVATCEC